MANATRGKSLGSRILGLLNPIRDPSLLVAVILTVIWEGGSKDPPYKWVLLGLLDWIAVKAVIWLFVNFAFSFVYLLRKGIWVLRHPRLAWRLLDAMGTEEIIIGGLQPDMFATDDGSLHEGRLAYSGVGSAAYYAGMLNGQGTPYGQAADADTAGYDGQNHQAGYREDGRANEMQQVLASHERLIFDWMNFTEEKWRAVSDSQLGWKPLRGRWNGWEEIYTDAFADRAPDGADPMARRFDNAEGKGSAASAVACFLHDLDCLRQSMVALEADDSAHGARPAGIAPAQPTMQRTAKSPIIRNPRIVDAD